jgi:hypothetical protein
MFEILVGLMLAIHLAFFVAWTAMPSFAEGAELPRRNTLSREALFDLELDRDHPDALSARCSTRAMRL